MDKKGMERALELLEREYPDAQPALEFSSPYELLVATVLSAQCTDRQVNICTRVLFQNYNTPERMLTLSEAELEGYIHSCGFFRTKAKNLLSMSRDLVARFNGEVPRTREELISLAGVGRKTANVVLSNAFNTPAIAVDTHVFRVANRIGLAEAKDVEKTELQLMENIPEERWSCAHHWLIYHGRRVCSAQRPKCEGCTIKEVCCYAIHRQGENIH
ncbi:MAG: endonuclease III [Clostridia bacterium]|nr:endonuclease III [Clostridia bacterium]